MAWIDYKVTFDMIPHSWLAECLEIYGAEESIIRFLKNTMPNWKTILTSSGTRLAEVNIRRGIIQGGSLSPLLFIVAMIPMTRVLKRMEDGYQLKRGGSRINHLMFMEETKLFRRGTTGRGTLAQTVRTVSGDIRMESGVEKCALVNIQRGKVTRTEGIHLPHGNNIRRTWNLVWILGDNRRWRYKTPREERDDQKGMNKGIENNTRVKTQLRKYCESLEHMSSTNHRVKAKHSYWKNSELCNMDRKTRKILNMYQVLCPKIKCR